MNRNNLIFSKDRQGDSNPVAPAQGVSFAPAVNEPGKLIQRPLADYLDASRTSTITDEKSYRLQERRIKATDRSHELKPAGKILPGKAMPSNRAMTGRATTAENAKAQSKSRNSAGRDTDEDQSSLKKAYYNFLYKDNKRAQRATEEQRERPRLIIDFNPKQNHYSIRDQAESRSSGRFNQRSSHAAPEADDLSEHLRSKYSARQVLQQAEEMKLSRGPASRNPQENIKI